LSGKIGTPEPGSSRPGASFLEITLVSTVSIEKKVDTVAASPGMADILDRLSVGETFTTSPRRGLDVASRQAVVLIRGDRPGF